MKLLTRIYRKIKQISALPVLYTILSSLVVSVYLTPSYTYAEEKHTVVIASKIDGEGALLGNMLVLLFEDANIPYVNKIQMGTTNVVRQALLSGNIDIYPEYTGNAAFMLNEPQNPVWKDLKKGYERAKKLDFEKNKLVWLQPAPANNTWAIAVREDLSHQYKLDSLEQLNSAIEKGMPFKIAAGAEFIERQDALPSFEKEYGFKLTQDQILAFPSNDTAVFIKTAAENNSGVNAATVYGTDGSLSAVGLKVLNDPKGAQPVYAPTPVIRAEILEQYPQIKAFLDPVFATLTTETLQELNSEVSIYGTDVRLVAQDYLKSKGFLK